MEEIAPLEITAARAPSPVYTVPAVPTVAEPLPPGWLTRSEQQTVAALGRRDQAVRHEEFDRLTAAGIWTHAGVDYEYRVGPDGRRYAVEAHPGMVAPLAPLDLSA